MKNNFITKALIVCIIGAFILLVPSKQVSAELPLDANLAPPTVAAEFIGTMLQVEATGGFFPLEAIFINGRRFNHRVNSALLVDVNNYIAQGETITIYGLDFAGNRTNVVLLTPPAPAIPQIITPEGQGQVIDHMTPASSVNLEFFTINTRSGNIFHLIIDHDREQNNVYFLNAVTEWDLIALAEDAEIPIPYHILNPPSPPEPAPEPTPEPTPTPVPAEVEHIEPEPESGSGGQLWLFIILGVVGFAAAYYFKIVRPKQLGSDEEDIFPEEEYDDEFEDVDDIEDFNNDEDLSDIEDEEPSIVSDFELAEEDEIQDKEAESE